MQRDNMWRMGFPVSGPYSQFLQYRMNRGKAVEIRHTSHELQFGPYADQFAIVLSGTRHDEGKLALRLRYKNDRLNYIKLPQRTFAAQLLFDGKVLRLQGSDEDNAVEVPIWSQNRWQGEGKGQG